MAKTDRLLCSEIVVKELLEISLLPYMLPVSGVLALLLVLTLLSVVTGGIMDGLDFDLDLDVDADIPHGGVFEMLFHFVNAGKVPTMIVLSVLSVFMWVSGVALTAILNPEYSNLLGVGLLVVAFIISVTATRYTVMPLIPVFKLLKQGEDNGVKIEGHRGTVKSIELTDKFGQVEIRGSDGPLLLNARLDIGEPALKKGDDIVVLNRSEDGKFCHVAKLKL